MNATATAPVRRLDDFGPYAAATKAKTDTALEIQELQRNISDLEAKASNRTPIEIEAARYVAGEHSGSDSAEFSDQLRTLRQRKRMLLVAIELQKEIEKRELYAAKRIISTSRLAEYRAIVAKMATALKALREVSAMERTFRETLDMAGVLDTSVIHPMPFRGSISSDGETEDAVDFWTKEAKEFGLL